MVAEINSLNPTLGMKIWDQATMNSSSHCRFRACHGLEIQHDKPNNLVPYQFRQQGCFSWQIENGYCILYNFSKLDGTGILPSWARFRSVWVHPFGNGTSSVTRHHWQKPLICNENGSHQLSQIRQASIPNFFVTLRFELLYTFPIVLFFPIFN